MLDNIFYDDYAVQTRDYGRMWDEVTRMDSKTIWQNIPRITSLRLHGITKYDVEDGTSEISQLINAVDTELAMDTVRNGTGLLMDADGTPFLVRGCALPTIYETAKISGASLARMRPQVQAETLNNGFSVGRGGCMAMICADKIAAVVSDGYKIMGTRNVFEIAMDRVEKRLGSLDFIRGYNAHNLSTMTFELPKAQHQFLKEYNSAVSGSAGQLRGVNIMPGVRITTSDTGFASSSISPIYRFTSDRGTSYLEFCTPIKVEHRSMGKNKPCGLDAFADEACNIFSKFNETISVIQRMAATTIYHPLNFIWHAGKRAKLPIKYLSAAVAAHQMLGEGQCSVQDCYVSIYEGFADVEDVKTRLKLEEQARKILRFNWRECDLDYLPEVETLRLKEAV